MTLEDLGWNAAFAEEFAPCREKGWHPARLIRDNKISHGALLGDGTELVVVTGGKVLHEAETDAELPAVGDWVAVETGGTDRENVIRARLTRQTCLSRKMSGRSTEEQVIAANVDVVVVVTDSGPDFNPRRMERYFAIIGRSRAKVVVLVNKADLFPAEQNLAAAEAIRALNPDAEVHITSLKNKPGLRVLERHLRRGQSLTFIGSSGTGKSSVINHLLGGDYQWTDEVNGTTGKGRHTTTARELMVLRKGGIIIDNPASARCTCGPTRRLCANASQTSGNLRPNASLTIVGMHRRRMRDPGGHGGWQDGCRTACRISETGGRNRQAPREPQETPDDRGSPRQTRSPAGQIAQAQHPSRSGRRRLNRPLKWRHHCPLDISTAWDTFPAMIVGIDLGTTHSLVGSMVSGFPVLVADENGNRLTPSAVWFPETGEPVVGWEALAQRQEHPDRVVTSVKRLMACGPGKNPNCPTPRAGTAKERESGFSWMDGHGRPKKFPR